ncbi:MAG: hypothetical protein ABFC24_13325 [Methanoregulaceae archaeon]
MARFPYWLICISVFLACALLFAGCSDKEVPPPVPTPTPSPTPTPLLPKFSAGDVITTPGSGPALSYLILGYDSATDKYTVAHIKQNPSGKWGYRPDGSSENRNRVAVENIYTVRLTTVDPDTIEIMPTATVTPVPTSTSRTSSVSATSTATPTPTATTGPAPLVKKTDPDYAVFNTTVSGVQITGMNFKENATVQLTLAGNSPINGSNVRYIGPNQIVCDFVIGDIPHVAWNVVVINPDGQSGKLSNYFTIRSEG